MSETIFKGLFDAESVSVIAVSDFLICILSSLVIGLIIAVMYTYKNDYSRSFIVTLAMIPAIVCAVIMMVNGNVGAGVATAGAFSLVRFRSLPGTAKEIGILFLAMGTGLITGMGYIAYGFLFAAVLSAVYMLYSQIGFGTKKQAAKQFALKKTMRITIPEDLDYTEIFDDLFEKGSLFRLTYDMTLKDKSMEKALIDDIRCRNGNLEITVSRQETIMQPEL